MTSLPLDLHDNLDLYTDFVWITLHVSNGNGAKISRVAKPTVSTDQQRRCYRCCAEQSWLRKL